MRTTRLCSVQDCDRSIKARELCGRHLQRFYATGDPLDEGHRFVPEALKGEANPLWKGDDATYSAIHHRLRTLRGPAREHFCVDCSAPAAQWSYTHEDPDEKQSEEGPYSTNPEFYVARCRSCHVKYDRKLSVG